MPETPYNAANPAHVKSRKRREERAAQQALEAVAYVMADPRGRHFVWNLLGWTGIAKDSFTGNSTTFYNEGRRSVGIWLQGKLENEAPMEFMLMWSEKLKEKMDAAAQDKAVRTNGAMEAENDQVGV